MRTVVTDLTTELLVHTTAEPNVDKLTAEIIALDVAIQSECDGPRKDYLCAAFQALNWARAPNAFAPPSEV